MFAKLINIVLLLLLLSACANGSQSVLERECLTNTHKSETYRFTRYVASGLYEDHVPLILKSMLLLVLPAAAIGDTLILPLTLWDDAAFQGQCLGWKVGIGRTDEPVKCQNWPKDIPKPTGTQTTEVTTQNLPACN